MNLSMNTVYTLRRKRRFFALSKILSSVFTNINIIFFSSKVAKNP
jgi:hypothetical protein